ncbi:hypothetical protein [Falsirhodobacter halotolerans]|uniref:hypothetical protein n=1 Tax=Falsirhodobacter halotolerans TaxID=1146892 RepID=UPI001FD0CA31|nr:hypothetical protein [Falsirhodobacter halotolerans]MCJ8138980.1 hypothetical protein [Falsirhodobacter halotolerans]
MTGVGIGLTVAQPMSGVSGAGARPWTPQDLPALRAWWDASDRGTMTLDGAALGQWRDKVGGIVWTQDTAASRPQWNATARNGTPGVILSGGRTMAGGIGGLPLAAAARSMLVSAWSDEPAVGRVVFGWGRFARGQMMCLRVGTRSDAMRIDKHSNPENATVTWDGKDRCVIHTRDAGTTGTFAFWVDGTAGGSGTGAGMATATGGSQLGSYPDGSNVPEATVVQQILVFDDVLTTEARHRLEGWESHKTGKGGWNLPEGHPFRAAPPMV